MISHRSEKLHSKCISALQHHIDVRTYIESKQRVFNNAKLMDSIKLCVKLITLQRYSSRNSTKDILRHKFYTVNIF